MRTRLALIAGAALVLAVPAAAPANPSIAVEHVPQAPVPLGGGAVHRLTLVGGERDETVRVFVNARGLRATGEATISPVTAVGGGLLACPGRHSAMHLSPEEGFRSDVTMVLRARGTVVLETVVQAQHPLWPGDDLSATWTIAPESGRAFQVRSPGPEYVGPRGVPVILRVNALGAGRTIITGRVDGPRTGRVHLAAYPPGRSRPIVIARVRIDPRDGSFAYRRWRPRAAGRWWVFARYRSVTRTFADDVSECGFGLDVLPRR